ncbi:DUF134 domain-containing protein [Ignisphaera sp. 4213-co]|uniref:DUF134 domain-containing protein n=1 Tax=Ignisphaera cupida TaxID=3050454 RepID=A0ABD4Z471_9CREN|nr:DUF134 domain-containing protein [Ignisphaera sp. 4213-co]MDK6028121.1 DUF134 domain-containing protein [Ignisphaera sp. 4213-co]
MPRHHRHRHGWFREAGPRIPIGNVMSVEDTIFIPIKSLENIEVKDCIEIYDYEIKALVYIHIEGLSTEEAANKMGLSKATFWRILEGARFKIAKALSERKPMKLVSTRQISNDNKSLLTEKQVSSTGEKNGLVVG